MDKNSDNSALQDTHRAIAVWRDVIIIVTLTVLGLYGGASFMIPLVLAILVFLLISAVSDRLRELWPLAWPMPVWLANLIGVFVVLSGIIAIMYVLASQATQFALTMPGYEQEVDSALHRLAELIGTSSAHALKDMIIGIDMTVVAVSAFGSARYLLSTFMIISFYVAFMMAERGVIVRKVQITTGHRQIGRDLPGVMREISKNLQRYVGVKSFLSVLTAGISYAVFLYMGLEFAETWAVLTFALNFIPSIGSVIAVLFPAAAALLQFESITPFLVILFGCGSIQFSIGNFLDPALLGRSLNLSTLVVILALTFWSLVWGITGAFLSVPLTVCLLIVFAHVPALRPLAVLMSQDGTLPDDVEEEISELSSGDYDVK